MLNLVPESRPRLALVLGSGGVRSIAAIGIADVLAREGIRPDLIVGCSSGALFGALIAMGMTSEQSLRTAQALWSAELTQQHLWRAYAQLVAPRLFGFDAGFALRDDRLIAQRLDRAFGTRLIESLPIALRIATTEAATGQALVLEQGRLVDALRASMALPLVFPSVVVGGKRLVDGVISDPLPVGEAGDADTVITLGFRGVMPRRVDRGSRLVAQVSTAMINNLMSARLEAARTAGQHVLAIELKLDRHVGLWQTSAMPYLFEAGRRAARERLPQIMLQLERAEHRSANRTAA
jgi:NTE family protein